jgi:pyruvate,water dikinase
VSHLYDERNPAVKALISQLIKVAKKKNVKVGICGQGPSDFPEFAEFLVQEGIDSISVTPDSVLKTLVAIHNIESKRS